ncbi:hypothetical protein HK096_011450 [Nowakowskiella sp. JEL0078]|nr:hypothetical protein HK096_011450 [Nowakowskiella sp. JEL0078]
MASLPGDYPGLYNSEAQVRAASMGYYDPSGYGQVAGGKYPGAEPQPTTTGQSSPGSVQSHQQQSIPLQQQAQQQFHNPYYFPYYMPNQFQNHYQPSAYGPSFVNKSVYPSYPTAQTQGSGGQPGTIPKPIQGGGYYQSAAQPHLYHGYEEITGQVSLNHIPQEYKNPAVSSQASMYAGPQQFGFGLNGAAPQVKQVGQPTNPQASGVDFKSQSNNRPPRQAYEPHKYQTQTSSGGGSGATQPSQVTAANSSGQGQVANGNVGTASPYYSQQHFGATGGVTGVSGGYQPPHLMHSYGGQGGAGLYGQNAAVVAAQQAAVAAARQGGPYWANQS